MLSGGTVISFLLSTHQIRGNTFKCFVHYCVFSFSAVQCQCFLLIDKSFAAMWAETWCMNSIMQVYFLRVWTQKACNNKDKSYTRWWKFYWGVRIYNVFYNLWEFYHPWSVGYAQVIPAKVKSSWWTWPIAWKMCVCWYVSRSTQNIVNK